MVAHIIDFSKAVIMAITMLSFGIYEGAALIAFIAALSRLAYTNDKASFGLFGRFFIMSLSLTMLIVHIGLLKDWSNDFVVIVSGVSAFMAREILESMIKTKDIGIIKKIMQAFK